MIPSLLTCKTNFTLVGYCEDNVAKALDNVEKLDQMELKAEEFENQAEQFQKNSNKVFKRMRCQNYKVFLPS